MAKKKITTRQSKKQARVRLIDDVVVIVFSLVSAGLLVIELTGASTTEQVASIRVLDTAIGLFFLVEFMVRLALSKDRRRFLLFRWWELLAAIPFTNVTTQALRSLKFIRLVELVRIVRATVRLEATGEALGSYTDHPYVLESLSSLIAVLFTSSVIFYALESGTNTKVTSLWDAFWWSTATLTTTGYGDISPVTTGGRIVAIFLMLIGVVMIAAFTGVVVRYMAARPSRGRWKM